MSGGDERAALSSRTGGPATNGQEATPAARPPRAAFGKLLLTEIKLALRTPVGLILGLGLPILLLAVFASIPSFRRPSPEFGGLTPLTIYIPILCMFVIAMLALVSLAVALSTHRELGVLRRISTTPVPPSWMLGAHLVINLGVALVGLLVITLGGAALGAERPQHAWGFALAIILATAALFAIGLWIASFARSANAANAIGQILFYPMMFFAGLYFPRELMPGALRHVSDWTPLGAAVQALQTSAEGSFPAAQPLLVMASYAVLFGVLAVKQFKWE
jgi:ABC-2 type transport system permease protein